MAAILGLIGTEDYAANRFKNPRRKVFYDYPNGAAPLTGLLSLMDEEDSDDPEFSWFEKRKKQQRTETASQGSSKGPFLTSAGADGGDPITLTAGTEYQLKVDASEEFRVGHIFRAIVTKTGGTVNIELHGRVTDIVSSTVIKFTPLVTVTGVDNGTTNENVDKEVLIIGSAYAQGAVGSSEAVYYEPIEPANYCQIFRSEFSITGTALKTSARYDETGPYKDKSKEASLNHMVELERAFMFGTRSKSIDATTNLPTYTTGGVLWHLQQWEAADSAYRGGTGAAAVTADTDDLKRIIENTSGTLNEKSYDGYLERVFRTTNNRANEKLCLCGNQFLMVVNQLYRSKSVLNADLPMTETYGMSVVRHLTPFGTLYYKTHPLYNENAGLRASALILDVPNLKYRYVQGRDTDLLKNRQPNNADYRMDEWLGECGTEIRFPEAHMFIKNVLDYTP